MIPPEQALQARKIAALIVPSIPAGFSDWVSVAASLWLASDGKGGGGGAQAYDGLGHATGFSFPIPPLRVLRAMHPEAGRDPWKTVLVQFGRAPDELGLRYEFIDPWRWTVTPGNFRSMIRTLRPDFTSIPPEVR